MPALCSETVRLCRHGDVMQLNLQVWDVGCAVLLAGRRLVLEQGSVMLVTAMGPAPGTKTALRCPEVFLYNHRTVESLWLEKSSIIIYLVSHGPLQQRCCITSGKEIKTKKVKNK